MRNDRNKTFLLLNFQLEILRYSVIDSRSICLGHPYSIFLCVCKLYEVRDTTSMRDGMLLIAFHLLEVVDLENAVCEDIVMRTNRLS